MKEKQPETAEKKEEKTEDLSRYRILGASVWLGLLILIVPYWYSHPVNFVPTTEKLSNETGQAELKKEATVKMAQPYLLPPTLNTQPKPDVVSKAEMAEKKTASNIKAEAVADMKAEQGGGVKNEQNKPEKPAEKTKPVQNNNIAPERWIVRLVAYKSKKNADLLLDNIRYQYPAYIKQYEKSKLYSVRTGPYDNKNQALADEKELKQLLKVKTELVKIPPSK